MCKTSRCLGELQTYCSRRWIHIGTIMNQTLNWKLHSILKVCHWFCKCSHVFTGWLLRASGVNECKAFHLVYVCQCWVWKPGPLNVVSVGPLIEPDQFTETASRLAQLPHQRDSNNCTLWPLPCLKKPYLCLLQSKPGRIEHSEHTRLRCSFSGLPLRHKAVLEQFRNIIEVIHTYINTTTTRCSLIRSLLVEWKPIKN